MQKLTAMNKLFKILNWGLILVALLVFPTISPAALWAQSPRKIPVASIAVFERDQKTYKDGPYIFYNPDNSVRVIACDGFSSHKAQQKILLDTIYANIAALGDFKVADDKGRWSFTIKNGFLKRSCELVKKNCEAVAEDFAVTQQNGAAVRRHSRSATQYSLLTKGEKIFAISDAHGNFKNFITLLQKGEVINEKLEWNYGKNRLVILGDTFDRGNDVLAILWLIYTLEYQASAVGGSVNYLLGNHDNMVLKGDLRYIKSKYKKLQDTLTIPYQQFFSAQSHLGNWLRSKNSIQIVGNTLFVHGGISPAFAKSGISIEQANAIIGKYLDAPKSVYSGDTATGATMVAGSAVSDANNFYHSKDTLSMVRFLFGSDGPLWYRGLVSPKEEYHPITEPELSSILKQYGVSRIVVGHTTFEGVKFHHNGKVISVDSENEKRDIDHLAQGIEIDGDCIKIVIIFATNCT